MENTQVKAPSMPHNFVQETVNLPKYMRIAPEVDPPVDLESLVSTFVKGVRSWLENDRQKTIEATIYKLASLGYLTMATPIDPLASAPVTQPVVFPGPVPIEIPLVMEEVPTPAPPTPEPEPEPVPEPVVETPVDPLEESHPVPAPPASKKAAKVKGKKTGWTPEEIEHEKKIYRVRKNFQQHNFWLRRHGKPPIPQPKSWDLLLNQKDETPESDVPPPSSEDG